LGRIEIPIPTSHHDSERGPEGPTEELVLAGTSFAPQIFMTVARQISQYARGRIVRRLARSMPWIGAVVAIAAVGTAVRRKGLFGGVVDTALDAVPGVGAVKNAIEAVRGSDFIKDKPVYNFPNSQT